jgi:hypothetical protein
MRAIFRSCTSATTGALLGFGLVAAANAADTAPTDAWAWRATLYGWLPSIHGSISYPNLSGGGSIEANANPSSYLSHLKFAFMGSLEARRGPWSVLSDAIYLNLGNTNSKVTAIGGPGGNVSVPVDLGSRTDLKGFVGMLAGGYAVLQQPGASADVIAGARYLHLKTSLNWQLAGPAGVLAREGSVEVSKDLWDGIVGVRGKVDVGGNWFVPYYLDGGAGSSRFTWQALVGLGYRYGWGDVTLAGRHLSYDFHGDRLASDVRFSGPALGVAFKF